jgi:hypothetical protein
MAHWDTSALLKLYLAEADSPAFATLAGSSKPPGTAFIARHEARAAFLRREGEGALPVHEADMLYQALLTDIASGYVIETGPSASLENE